MNVDSLNTAFSLKINETIYAGNIKVCDNNCLELKLTSPGELSGLVVVTDGLEVTTGFGGASVCAVAEENVFVDLHRAIEALKNAENFSKVAAGYEIRNDDFSAVLDSDGNIKWLNVSDGEFYFK